MFCYKLPGQFSHKATDEHWNAAMDVLRYIKATKNLELVYRATNNLPIDRICRL